MLALQKLFVVLLAVLLSMSCNPLAQADRGMTNAERFARGLPPNRPRVLYQASNVLAAARTKRSPTSGFDCAGYVTPGGLFGTFPALRPFCCKGNLGTNLGYGGIDPSSCTGTVPPPPITTSPACPAGYTAYCCAALDTDTGAGVACDVYQP